MKLSLRLLAAYIVSAFAVVLFGAVAWLIGRNRLTGFDADVIAAVQGWESPGLTKVMRFFSWIGSTKPAIVLCLVLIAILYIVLKHRKELILFVVAMAGSPLLNVLLKALFHRERPNLQRLAEQTGFSFPSGHAMSAFSLYGILTYLLWRHIPSVRGRYAMIVIGSLIALNIGISRVYLGVHYPSDVIGGYLASGVWLGLAIGVYESYLHRRNSYRGNTLK